MVIAWFGPDDPAAPESGDLWAAARITVDLWNRRQTGQGAGVVLTPCWAANPWSAGVSQLFRFVHEGRPIAILGSIDGATTHLAEQVVAKARLPLVNPVSTDSSLHFAGVSWIFSCPPSDNAVAEAIVEDLRAGPKATSGPVALVRTTDHDARTLGEAIEHALHRRRDGLALRLEFPPGGDTFQAQLRTLVTARPAAVILVAGPSDSARFLVDLWRRRPGIPVWGTPAMDRWGFEQQLGDVAGPLRYPSLAEPDAAARFRAPDQAAFLETFLQTTGHVPDTAAWLVRDATRLLLEAVNRAGADRQAVRQALRDLSPWEGVVGTVRFDGLGRNQRTNLTLREWRLPRLTGQ